MAEVSIAKHLSGTEVLESILHEFRKRVAMDGRFQSHMAYQGYRAEISFKFYPAMSFVPQTEREMVIEEGEGIDSNPSVQKDIEIPVRPPNQVREDADMPTPVLVTDATGKSEEKWVKRSKGVPKNKVKGGEIGLVPPAQL